nr:HesA/MoeB/ThiF family protein [uncultured Psychroserpens sp.]
MSSIFEVQDKLIGKTKSQQLKNSRIAIVGLGGLGCSVAMGIVRLGINNLVLIDNDKIEVSNIPRQILFEKKDIGHSKIVTAKQQLLDIFEDLTINCIDDFITVSNGTKLLENVDIVIDCTDNYMARYAVSKTCLSLKIPMIYGGVQAFEGQIGTFNYNKSKPFHILFPNLNTLLLEEKCEASGVLPFVVQTVANLQIIEAYKIICGEQNVLSNQLLCINTLSNKSRIINLNH